MNELAVGAACYVIRRRALQAKLKEITCNIQITNQYWIKIIILINMCLLEIIQNTWWGMQYIK